MNSNLKRLLAVLCCTLPLLATPPTCQTSAKASKDSCEHQIATSSTATDAQKRVKVIVVKQPVQQSIATDNQTGLIAFRDPETGKLRQPTAEEAAALLDKVSNTQQRGPVEEIHHGDFRGVQAKVPESLHSHSVKIIGKDGKAYHGCADGSGQIDASLEALKQKAAKEAADVK